VKILLLSRYSYLGASSRVRFYQYLPYLETNGIKVTVAPLLGDYYLRDLYKGRRKNVIAIFGAYLRRLNHLLKSRHFDLLWIEKELLPWLPAWVERILARLGIPYVVDYDDAVFHRYDMHTNGVVRTFLGGKIEAVMRQAALVIVGNDYLAERARLAGARRIERLPSVIDLQHYPQAPLPNKSVFTIGWIGSPSTSSYLEGIAPALAEVYRDNDAKVVLIGAGEVSLRSVPVEYVPWSAESEVTEMQRFDVGIMPLVDSPWERGKCGYKLIQYMACGRPVVASPVGVNKQIIEEGVNGFLAATTSDWVRALNALRDNPDLRKRMGIAGRKRVESEYCLHVTTPRLMSLLSSVVKRPR
jgi:glycosyltransferase involved in cell wall biosynthesis